MFKLTSCYSRYLAGVPHKAQLALRLHLAHMQRSRAWPASTHATGRWPSLSHCSAACSICHAPQIRRYLLQRVQAAEAAAAAAASAAPAATGAAGSSAEGSGGQEGGTAASGAAATAFLQLLDEASVRQSDVRVAIRRAAREQGLHFVAFGPDVDRFDVQLRHMCGLVDDGVTDRLLDFTTPLTGSFWFCPSIDELDRLAPAADEDEAGARVSRPRR